MKRFWFVIFAVMIILFFVWENRASILEVMDQAAGTSARLDERDADNAK